jgi:HD-GYP domain-containing protein (c-di-GMP phosphodiesterase class II)
MELTAPTTWMAAALMGTVASTCALAVRLRRAQSSRPVAPKPNEPEAYLATIRTLASVIDVADPFTRGRSERMARICLQVGRGLGMNADELRDLEYAALLHDIGKTAIHYDILLKAGRLSERETESVRNHPEIGWRILKEIPYLTNAAEIVLAHHEQPDGRGYPKKLTGKDIPLGSRIIMAVAAYDAMVSDRPYRSGLSTTDAFEELLKCSGKMFDEDVVKMLVALHARGELNTAADDASALFGESMRTEGPERAPAMPFHDRAGDPAKAPVGWGLKS